MKTSFGTALKAHCALETTTLAYCWKVTLTNGAVYGFTNHDTDITYPPGSPTGVLYRAATGFTSSAIASSADLSVDNSNLAGMLTSPCMTEADLIAGVWDFAAFEFFVLNWNDLSMGAGKLRTGTIGNVTTGRHAFEAELRGLMQRLQQSTGRLYGPDCDATLGDTRCGVALGPLTVTGTLTGVTSNRVFTDFLRGEDVGSPWAAIGYFNYGVITWTGGLNNGLSADVKTSEPGGILKLYLPMPYTVAIGDTYSLVPGCDKKPATCSGKFSNKVNFRGYEWIPGQDWQAGGVQ